MPDALAYRFAQFRLVPDRRLLLAGGEPVKLGSRAFEMLQALVERRQRTVSKQELLDLVWPGLVVEENNLQVQIVTLRKLLGHPAIATVPGRGYRFTMPVAVEGGGAPAAPPAPPAGNLAGAEVALIGRDDELRTLNGLIDGHALVTVAGAGGIGKTRLAQGAAAARGERHADGVWWVELSPLADPALVPTAVAKALGVALDAAADATPAVLAALKGRAALIVLDNAEHLLDGVAAFVAALRGATPSVKLLVTSQEILRTADEQVFRPGPLALPGQDDLASAQASGAVALFVARARAVDPRFRLDEGNLAAVVEICRQLDGIPLAIELAAARLPLLGVQGLRQRLDERFRLLTAGRRAVMRRHQTLRAALDWSHGLLTPPEQVVFRRLGVFAGGFDLDAAERIADDDALDGWDVVEHLGALVDKSLVVVEGDDEPRYRLLETTRLYAIERLAEAGETDALLRRHAEHFTTLAESLDESIAAHGQGAQAMARLDLERDNLLHAIAWCERADDRAAQVALRLAAALRYFWPSHALLELGRRLTLRALARAETLPWDRHRVAAATSAAQLLYWTGQLADAEALVREVGRRAEALGDGPAQATASILGGHIAFAQGRLDDAGASFDIGHEMASRGGWVRLQGNALSGRVTLLRALGRHAEAAALHDELLALRRRDGHGFNLAVALLGATTIAADAGDAPCARDRLREAFDWIGRTGSRALRLSFVDSVPEWLALEGRWGEVAVLRAASSRSCDELGLPPDAGSRAAAQRDLATARERLGDAAFDAAVARGRALDLDAAVAHARAALDAQP